MPQLSCAAAEETGYPGSLMIWVTSSVGFFPVVGAAVTISDSASPEQILETLTTDESGQTTSVLLPAPDPAYSQSHTPIISSKYRRTVTSLSVSTALKFCRMRPAFFRFP